jgi:hypothetical protein
MPEAPVVSSVTPATALIKPHLENQETDEIILVLFRRHFSSNLTWIIVTALLLLIPPFITALSQQFSIPFPLPNAYILVLLFFYYLAVFGYAFLNFFSWFYNVGIVSNLRIIQIQSPSVLSQNVASAYLQDVVDVKYSQRGFFQSLYNFGYVEAQTEGMKVNFEFLSVPQPALLVDIILDAKAGRKTNV